MHKGAPFLLACLASCGTQEIARKPDVGMLPRDVGLFVIESSSNFDSAAIEVVDPETHGHRLIEGFGIDSDMHLRRRVDPRTGRARILIVNSRRGTITERLATGQSVGEYPVYDEGKASSSPDPLDVAIASDGSLWVTRFFQSTLMVLEPDGKRRRTVDLAAFADADGIPEMSAIAIVGDTAYVALRNLTRKDGQLQPTNVSKLVAIDTKTYEPRPYLDLPAPNPWEEIGTRDDGPSTELWISCIGGPLSKPRLDTGALVRVDLSNATAKAILLASEIKGFVVSHHVVSETEGFAIVAGVEGDNPTSVVRFDPSRGTLGPTFATTAQYKLWDVRLVERTELLLVADRSEQSPGLRVLSRRDGTVVGHISTRLPPIELLVLRP